MLCDMGLRKGTEMRGAGMWDSEFGHQMLDGVHGGNMEVQGKRWAPPETELFFNQDS